MIVVAAQVRFSGDRFDQLTPHGSDKPFGDEARRLRRAHGRVHCHSVVACSPSAWGSPSVRSAGCSGVEVITVGAVATAFDARDLGVVHELVGHGSRGAA